LLLEKKRKAEIMKSETHLVAVGLALVLISLISAPCILAQHAHDQSSKIVWKTGMLRLSKSVWAGDVRLKRGMYHVKHVVEGNRHVIVFKPVALPAGYKEFSMFEGKEVTRLECSVEPVTKQVRNTKIRLGKNGAGDLVIVEIQIAGEDVKHILSESSPQLESKESLKWPFSNGASRSLREEK